MESTLIELMTVAAPADDVSISNLLMKASPVVKGVLVVLVAMSLIVWYIIIYKWLYLRKARRESERFITTFWDSKRLDEIYRTTDALKYSPTSQVFRAGYVELTKLKSGKSGDTMHEQMGDFENIERALRRSINAESLHLEKAHFVSRDDSECGALYRPLRNRLGDHGVLSQHLQEGGRFVVNGRAGYR